MISPMLGFLLLNLTFQMNMAIVGPYVQIMLRNKGYSHSFVGIIIAIGQIATIIFPILVSVIDDRSRRTRAIAIALVALGAAFFLPAALSGSVILTVISFFLSMGLYMSGIPLLDGYQSRVMKGDSNKYGIARSVGTMGYVMALTMFSVFKFPDESDNWSICLTLLVMAAVFLVSVMFVPKDLPAENDDPGEKKRFFSFSWFSKKYYLMMLIVGLTRVAQTIPEKPLSSYMTEILGLGSNFAVMTALGALSEFVMIIAGGWLLQKGKVTSYTLIVLSAIALAVRLLIYYFLPSVTGLVLGQLLHSMTFGALHIGVTKFIAQNVNRNHYALAMSFYCAIATNMPEMLGALLGGFIIDMAGYPNLFLSFTAFPILAFILAIAWKGSLYQDRVK